MCIKFDYISKKAYRNTIAKTFEKITPAISMSFFLPPFWNLRILPWRIIHAVRIWFLLGNTVLKSLFWVDFSKGFATVFWSVNACTIWNFACHFCWGGKNELVLNLNRLYLSSCIARKQAVASKAVDGKTILLPCTNPRIRNDMPPQWNRGRGTTHPS